MNEILCPPTSHMPKCLNIWTNGFLHDHQPQDLRMQHTTPHVHCN